MGITTKYKALFPILSLLCACAPSQDKQQAQQFCNAHGYQADSTEFNSCLDAFKKAQARVKQIKENCDRETGSAYVTSDPSLTDDEAKTKANAARADCIKAEKSRDKDQLFQQQQLYLIERELTY